MSYTNGAADHDGETASLTADVVLLCEGNVLLIQRGNPPFQGRWALPGGFVDPGEGTAHAAARELGEETSLTAEQLVYVGAYGAPGRDPRGRVVSFAYAARLPDQLAPTAGDDARRAEWVWVADVLGNPGRLAFDHAQILGDALGIVPQAMTGTDLRADTEQTRALYRERAHLVAALAARYTSRLASNDENEPELAVLYVQTPAGQISWHIHPDDLDLFTRVPRVERQDALVTWDGHGKDEALARLLRLTKLEVRQ